MAFRTIFNRFSLPELATGLRSMYAASAQREILGKATASLALVNNVLINTANGEARNLDLAQTDLAEQLASAAAAMNTGQHGSAILLLLPPAEFVGTPYKLGFSGESMIRSALQLQLATLLPAYDRKLLLALNGAASAGTALWYPAQNADHLYQAFAAQGLELVAIMPRALVSNTRESTAGSESSHILQDQDLAHTCLIELCDDQIKNWLCVPEQDLADDVFRAQWQAEKSRAGEVDSVIDENFFREVRTVFQPMPQYCFIPTGALAQGKAILARKQRLAGTGLIAALIMMALLPFLSNAFQLFRLERQLDELRMRGAEASASQAAVFDMEDEWGAVADFPRQDVGQVLLSLNSVIEGSLSSFTLNKGVIDISGFSQDPSLLMEQLSQMESFYNVGQSRSSSGSNVANRGDRFGVRMNLSGIDFTGYEESYPPTQP